MQLKKTQWNLKKKKGMLTADNKKWCGVFFPKVNPQSLLNLGLTNILG